jgi:pimeloyl-ACP methyl ester carboxylesterase
LQFEGREIAAISTRKELPDNPLLCLHGWLDNAASFQPLMLSAPELPWLAIDWPGHGFSPHRASPYHLVEYVDDLYGLQRAYQWPQLVLIGHSLGGMVASIYAGSFPEKISELVLIEAVGPMAWAGDEAPDILRKALISRRKQQAAMNCYSDFKEAVAARRAAQSCLPQAAAELLVKRNLVKQKGRWFWRSDPKLRTLSPLRMTSEQAVAWCRSIQSPTLIVEGINGYPMVKQAIAERLMLFKEAKHVVLSGGHHLHMTHTEELVNLLKKLIGGL